MLLNSISAISYRLTVYSIPAQIFFYTAPLTKYWRFKAAIVQLLNEEDNSFSDSVVSIAPLLRLFSYDFETPKRRVSIRSASRPLSIDPYLNAKSSNRMPKART
jgi:hypothetical protein